LLPLGGARATASAFFAAIRRVGHRVFTWRAGLGDFPLPRHEFAESRDHEDQRKSAADDPDSSLVGVLAKEEIANRGGLRLQMQCPARLRL